MATKIGLTRSLLKTRVTPSVFKSFSSGKVIFNKQPEAPRQGSSTSAPTSAAISGDVPGLSSTVVQFGNDPVGPGASKQSGYKNPEYFCYNQISYFEAEIEMLKYRCPQPSSKK